MKLLSCIVVLFAVLSMPVLAGDWKELDSISDIPDDAKSINSSIPIYSQKIEHNLPKGWKPAFDKVRGPHYIIEFVPEGQSIKKWDRMFTAQGFKGAAEKISPKEFLDQVAKMHQKICGDKAVVEFLGEQEISGYEAHGAIIGCALMPSNHPTGVKKGMGEIAYYIAVKGEKEVYVFHKAMRGDSFDPKSPPLTKENGEAFIAEFMPIRLCKKESKFNECLK